MRADELTNEQIKDLDQMFTGIAYRKKRIIPNEYDIDDIKTEFWLVALKCINEMGSIEKSLIAMKCYSRLVDLVRESVRRSAYTMDISVMERMGNTEDGECEYGSSQIENDTERSMNQLIIKDMFSKFKEGTDEYKYLKFMIQYHTEIDIGEKYNGPAKITAMDAYLAEMLGFASGSSGGYRKVRNKVRTMIKLYEIGADIDMMYQLETLGFKCYGDNCLGWKTVKLRGANVYAEVYMSKRGKGFTLFVNNEEVTDFDTLDELSEILKVIKSMKN